MDYSRYPENWKEISLARRVQAGQKCEWCAAPNGETIFRKRGTGDYLIWHFDAFYPYKRPDGTLVPLLDQPEGYDYDKPVRIILTVHHIGVPYPDGRPGDPHDKMDVRPENLVALCQRCHLRADMPIHVENARKTRLRKKQAKAAALGQKSLFEGQV